MSLTQQLRGLADGECLAIEPKLQTAAYVTAKRIGIHIRTEKHDNLIRIYRVRNGVNLATLSEVIEAVKTLNVADRLNVFDAFELCCGMNRGACICPPEEIVIAPVDPRSTVDTLRELIAPIERGYSVPVSDPVAEDWRFTKDAPQYDDSGRVYRQQYLAPLGKRRRSVEVDAEDLELIIERVK